MVLPAAQVSRGAAANAPRVAFMTLGCKVNQYDSEAMLALFRRAGYQEVAFAAESDVYVVNTCTVTGRAAAKSRQIIRQAVRRSPDATVVVTGCYTQVSPAEVAALPGVNLVIGNQDRSRVVELVEQARATQAPLDAVRRIWQARTYEDMPVATRPGRTRAVLKIQEGCNVFCSYCVIPYARGKPRSRDPESIYREALHLVEQGHREVVLTGIHLGAYGADFGQGSPVTLAQVVENLTEIEGLDRIRLSSLEPGHVSDHLLELLAGHPKVCRHLHLSLQSGAATVLQRMRRAYTAEQYRAAAERIRRAAPEMGLSTDVIVGFPGETAAEHAESLAFVREIGFSRLHVFPFSARSGTPAAAMPEQTTVAVRQERAEEMSALGHELALEFGRRFVGRSLDVLVETEADTAAGWLEGYTEHYLRVRFAAGDELKNCIVPVQITAVSEALCQGEIAGRAPGRRGLPPAEAE